MSLKLQRTATHSASYEEKLKNVQKLPKEAKQKRLEAILADKRTAMQRIGQGMIGPIQIRLRYEGIVRNVLVEDTLERGPLMPYDILDDLGRAYVLNSTDAEVRITPFEGKQAFPQLFRIASFPRIRKEDLYYLRVNAVEYAQDERVRPSRSRRTPVSSYFSKQPSLTSVSSATTTVIGTGPTGGRLTGNAAGVGTNGNEQSVLIGAGNPLEPNDFYNAVSQIEVNQLEAKRVLAHPVDIRDLYTWDLNVTGNEFKDKVFGGGRSPSSVSSRSSVDHRPAGRGLPHSPSRTSSESCRSCTPSTLRRTTR
jgi:hypothetical protein